MNDPQWDADGAYAVGAALADTFALVATGQALVVGRDMRLTGPVMSRAFTDGVLDQGADVIDIGLASTDQLWFASGHLGLPGAMFTASHNPGDYNGIKFCLRNAAPIEPEQLVEIARRALAGAPDARRATGPTRPSRTCCSTTPPTCTRWSISRASAG